MKYTISTSKKVDKFLESHLDIAKRFVKCLDILEEDPYKNNLDTKSLKGQKNHYRLRIGKYRFLYEIQDQEILIYFYDADGRGDIYK